MKPETKEKLGEILKLGFVTAFFGIAGYCAIMNIRDKALQDAESARNRVNESRMIELITKEEFMFKTESQKLFRELQLDSSNATNYIRRMKDLESEHEKIMWNYNRLKTGYATGNK